MHYSAHQLITLFAAGFAPSAAPAQRPRESVGIMVNVEVMHGWSGVGSNPASKLGLAARVTSAAARPARLLGGTYGCPERRRGVVVARGEAQIEHKSVLVLPGTRAERIMKH